MTLLDDHQLESTQVVHDGVVQFFLQLLSVEHVDSSLNISDIIPRLITEEDNLMLCRMPALEKVWETIFSISHDSSLGPDGFVSSIYILCWEIMGGDILEAIQQCFEGLPLPNFFYASYFVLIPKVDKLDSFAKFHPISLCVVAYKIFSKLLVARLSTILVCLRSEQHTQAFHLRTLRSSH